LLGGAIEDGGPHALAGQPFDNGSTDSPGARDDGASTLEVQHFILTSNSISAPI
jgi:hypothetical protein